MSSTTNKKNKKLNFKIKKVFINDTKNFNKIYEYVKGECELIVGNEQEL